MKILTCHNHYQQPGGEDGSFAAECAMLENGGHAVVRHTVHNDAIHGMSGPRAALKTLWNSESYRTLRELIRRERPDVMHCTNTFPLISPAAYDAAAAEGLPVIQSLHNYRLMCVNGYLMRDGGVCESCLGKTFAWPGVVHKCYRGSRGASATVALMVGGHRVLGTWSRKPTRYIALTDFARGKYVEAGLPAAKIRIKPNFLDPDPGLGEGRGGYAFFVGRLSEEKGLRTLVEGWRRSSTPITLKIAGDGPMMPFVREAAAADTRIEPLGRQPGADVLRLLGDAAMLVLPSVWYEGLPLTIIEAFAKGTPVLASDLGSMVDLIDHGRTGMKFRAGDADDLAAKLAEMLAPGVLEPMRAAARAEYLAHFTAERNLRVLTGIYREAIEEVSRGRAEKPARAEASRGVA